jgi:EAL domain-containing protein (putative c-di-GMP-specific phosphodiesterase class I)
MSLGKSELSLDGHDIWPCFLPVAAVSSGDGYYEALMRTSHPAGHVALIAHAEQTGTMGELDCHMLASVLAVLRSTRSELCIGINVSAVTIQRDAERWLTQLADGGDLAHRVVVELTETADHSDAMAATAFVRACRTLGARIAIDDYDSDLFDDSLVNVVCPDFLKLGEVWKGGSDHNPKLALASALARLGSVRKRHIVVEWVDSYKKYSAAQELSVSHVQGGFVGGHVDVRELIKKFGSRRRAVHFGIGEGRIRAA